MKKFLVFFLFVISLSCLERDSESLIEPLEFGDQNIVTDASGLQYPSLDPTVVSYCGQGWGRKFCRFLSKYDGTIWTDTENYYSEFSDIKFSRFTNHPYFISFFKLNNNFSYCDGWKLGETTYNGIKWNIEIKKDKEDAFWFEYDYYGSSEEIEYSITYKYEVIDGLLHFSSSEDQTFIFNLSEKNYSEIFAGASEIILFQGCLF